MTVPERAVVVGFDASPASRRAVSWAAGEAEARGRPLAVVRSFDWPWPPTSLPPSPTVSAIAVDPDDLREAARTRLDDEVAELRRTRPGLAVSGAVIEGHAALVLAAVADDTEAELVVVGASGAGSVELTLLGSTAAELVRATHRPAVVVRGTEARPSREGPVIAGTDGTRSSRRAMGFAFDFAARHGLRVVLVHAWEASPLDPVLGPLLRGKSDPDGLHAAADALVSSQVEQYRARFPDVPVERAECRESPAQALLEQAEGASLLVVGSHGRGLVGRALLGSVSHRVLGQAPCPVAVLRQLDDAETGAR